MPVELRLPDIGEGMQEGEIVKWLVEEGEHVAEDQPVVEVQTDKVLAEIPAPASGVVDKIFAKAGTVVPVNDILLRISVEGGGKEGVQSSESEQKSNGRSEVIHTVEYPPSPTQKPVSRNASASGGRALAAPATRRLARKLGVDIEHVTGSGPRGRVMEEDVRRAAATLGVVNDSPVTGTMTANTFLAQQHGDRDGTVAPKRGDETSLGQGEKLDLTGLRGVIAKNMVQSAFTIPHVTHFDEADVTELICVRERVKKKFAERGTKLTYLPFFMKAIVVALQQFPMFNATWSEDGNEVWLHKTYNIGVAVDTEDGLVVPVVRDVHRKSITSIAKEIESLAEKARKRRLTREEMSGGTFTVSNVGPVGGLFATPIIRYPEVALMAFHKVKARPVAVEDGGERKVAVRDMMNVSVSFDHRVADGVTVVRFTNRILELLESPEELLIELT